MDKKDTNAQPDNQAQPAAAAQPGAPAQPAAAQPAAAQPEAAAQPAGAEHAGHAHAHAAAGAAQPAGQPQANEEKLIEAGAQTMQEMKDAMELMRVASTQMMQAFIDMRLSYLKVMRAGLEDPHATMEMMAKNATDMAKAAKNAGRTEKK